MKILRLDSHAFGPVADFVLDFESGPNLHVIYDPEQADHPSVARALGGLFFGFSSNALPADRQTRLAAVLRHSDGDTLEIQRRGSSDSASSDPRALARFLGGMDEAAFVGSFVLDCESLAQGARELLRVKGRLARRRAPDDWERRNRSLQTGLERRAHLQQRLDELRERQRLRDAGPLFARRREILRELGDLRQTSELPKGFGERRRLLERQLLLSQEQERELQHSLDQLIEQLQQTREDRRLHEHQDEVEDLQRRLGEYQRASRDLQSEELTLRQLHSEFADLHKTLGKPDEAPFFDAEELLAQRHLSNQHPRLQAQLESARLQTSRLEQQRASLDREWHTLKDVRDLASLQRHLHRWQATLARRQEAGALRNQLSALEQALGDHRRHTPDGPTMPVSLPDAQVLERIQHDWEQNVSRQQSLQQQSRRNEEMLAEVAVQLRQLRGRGETATPGDLVEARRRRDQTWENLLENQHTTAQWAERFAAEQNQADRMADVLLREAEGVGRKSELLAHKERLDAHGQQLIHELVALRLRHERLQQEWTQLWQPLGVTPSSPGEMRVWASQHASLVRERRRAEEIREQLSELEASLESVRDEIRRAVPELADGSLADLTERAQEFLDTHETQSRRRLEVQRVRETLEVEAEHVENRVRQLQQEEEHWQTNWAPHARRLGLPADAEPAALQARQELFGKWSHLRRHIEELSAAQAERRRELASFEESARRLARACLPDEDAEPGALVESMARRLRHDWAARESNAGLRRQHEQCEQKLRTAEQARQRAVAALEDLCLEAGVDAAADLPGLEDRALERKHLQRELTQIERQLERFPGARALEDLPTQADDDAVDDQIADLTRQLRDLEQTLGKETVTDDSQNSNELAAAHEPAFLRRAGQLFQKLTVGAFTGLGTDLNERGETVLHGERAEDRVPIAVEAMSEAALEQLSFALRLANLEVYFENHEPMPVILNDLLPRSSDDRALALLRVLAEFSRHAQILCCTSCEVTVDLAERHFTGQDVAIHRLQASDRSRQAALDLF